MINTWQPSGAVITLEYMLPQRQTSAGNDVASRPQCKGTLFVNLKSFVEGRGSNWQELVGALEERDRKILDGMVLVGGWYPVGVWNRLLERYLARVKAPSTEMAEIARYVADHDLNTIYKALLRMGSPGFVLARSDALWRRYFDVGTFGHSEIGPREWSLWLEAPAHADQGPDVWTCNEGVSNWLTHALRLTGAKTGAVTHVRCRFQGAPRCEYQARW